MSIKYFTWKMKSRGKVDTNKGVDEHETYDSNTGEFCKKLGFEHTGEEDRSELETGLVFQAMVLLLDIAEMLIRVSYFDQGVLTIYFDLS